MKIAVCIPCHGDARASFTASLAEMFYYTARALPAAEIKLFMLESSDLADARNRLVHDALTWGTEWLLLLDADHAFRRDLLTRMLNRNKPVLAINQPRRGTPTAPNSKGLGGSLIYTTEEKIKARLLEPAERVGCGVLLVARSAIDAIQLHADANGQKLWPLFAFIGGSEDAYFSRRLREAGIELLVDHELSANVGHVHLAELTYKDTLGQREEWERLHPQP